MISLVGIAEPAENHLTKVLYRLCFLLVMARLVHAFIHVHKINLSLQSLAKQD